LLSATGVDNVSLMTIWPPVPPLRPSGLSVTIGFNPTSEYTRTQQCTTPQNISKYHQTLESFA
jgi:hypothetical protein